jgi:hypothetical protein
MSQGLILNETLSSAYWEKNERKKKKTEKRQGAFFPRARARARHALLAVPGGILAAVRYN